jgi:hypothetical protein
LWLFAVLASVMMLVVAWFERHPLSFGTPPVVPDDAGRTQLIWASVLFALSLLPLVGPGASRGLRVFGILYAMLGIWLLLATWLG